MSQTWFTVILREKILILSQIGYFSRLRYYTSSVIWPVSLDTSSSPTQTQMWYRPYALALQD